MRILEIEVEQLFGTFDHRIPLNTEDRITLIHGPNGFGKTILLEMLYGLFNGHYETLQRVPFRRFVVHFDDGARVSVRQVDLGHIKVLNHELRVELDDGDGKTTEDKEFTIYAKVPSPSLVQNLDLVEEEESSWWREVQQSIRIELIREQRLTRMRTQSAGKRKRQISVPTITEHSKELAGTLEKKRAESVTLSQSLERTFPARLVERIQAKGPSENELTAKFEKLERRREQLQDAGILDAQEKMPLLPTEKLGEETREVLAVYVEDAEKKLSIFEELASKVELFKDIINSRFLYKRLAISRQDGFVFTTWNDQPLPLTALSSGEQNEVILLYELLFRLEPDSLVLIDEPEISLHVAWQKKFLEDLAKITELASVDVLIATHSPQIIHKRWDLTVELASPRVEASTSRRPTLHLGAGRTQAPISGADVQQVRGPRALES